MFDNMDMLGIATFLQLVMQKISEKVKLSFLKVTKICLLVFRNNIQQGKTLDGVGCY